MDEQPFTDGAIIYREGQPSDCVYVIRRGEVRVLRQANGHDVLLNILGQGAIFGETGVLKDQTRSTTMQAKGDVAVLRATREEFLSTFGDDNPFGLPLLRMLCERLSHADERVLKNSHEGREPASADDVKGIRLLAASPASEFQIGSEGITVSKLPFRVGGREALSGGLEIKPDRLYLMAMDALTICPEHFAIDGQDKVLVVEDLGSNLGTVVNGTHVSRFNGEATAPLWFGENVVVAGGLDSPYRFTVLVDRAPKNS